MDELHSTASVFSNQKGLRFVPAKQQRSHSVRKNYLSKPHVIFISTHEHKEAPFKSPTNRVCGDEKELSVQGTVRRTASAFSRVLSLTARIAILLSTLATPPCDCAPHVRLSETVLNSRFLAVDSGFHVDSVKL